MGEKEGDGDKQGNEIAVENNVERAKQIAARGEQVYSQTY